MRAVLLSLAGLIAGNCARAAISAAGIASVTTALAGFGGDLIVALIVMTLWGATALVSFGLVAGIGAACGVIETPEPKERTDV